MQTQKIIDSLPSSIFVDRTQFQYFVSAFDKACSLGVASNSLRQNFTEQAHTSVVVVRGDKSTKRMRKIHFVTRASNNDFSKLLTVFYDSTAAHLIWAPVLNEYVQARLGLGNGVWSLPYAVERRMAFFSPVPCCCYADPLDTVRQNNIRWLYNFDLIRQHEQSLGLRCDDRKVSDPSDDSKSEAAEIKLLHDCAFDIALAPRASTRFRNRLTALYQAFIALQQLRHAFSVQSSDVGGTAHFRTGDLFDDSHLVMRLFDAAIVNMIGTERLKELGPPEETVGNLLADLRLRDTKNSRSAVEYQLGTIIDVFRGNYDPSSAADRISRDLTNIAAIVRHFQLLEPSARRKSTILTPVNIDEANDVPQTYIDRLPLFQRFLVHRMRQTSKLGDPNRWIVISSTLPPEESPSPLELVSSMACSKIPGLDYVVTYDPEHPTGTAYVWVRKYQWASNISYGDTLVHAIATRTVQLFGPTISNGFRTQRHVSPLLRATAVACRLRIVDLTTAWPLNVTAHVHTATDRLAKGLRVVGLEPSAMTDYDAPLWHYLEAVLPTRVDSLFMRYRHFAMMRSFYVNNVLLPGTIGASAWGVLEATQKMLAKVTTPIDGDAYVRLPTLTRAEHHMVIDEILILPAQYATQKRELLTSLRVGSAVDTAMVSKIVRPPRLPLPSGVRRIADPKLTRMAPCQSAPNQEITDENIETIDSLLRLVSPVQYDWKKSEDDPRTFLEPSTTMRVPTDRLMAIHRSHIYETRTPSYDSGLTKTEVRRTMTRGKTERPLLETLPGALTWLMVNYVWMEV